MDIASILQHINGYIDFHFFTGNDFSKEKFESLVNEQIEQHSELNKVLPEISNNEIGSLWDTTQQTAAYNILFGKPDFDIQDVVRFYQKLKEKIDLEVEQKKSSLRKDIDVLSPVYMEMFPENEAILNDILVNNNKMRIPELLNKNVFAKIGVVKDAQICAMAMMDRCSKLFAGLDLSRFGDFEKPFDGIAT